MVKIKICGLKREQDIDYVNRSMPDYVGFIFAGSRRQVAPEQARLLTEKLDAKIKRVGIFVNEDIDKVMDIVSTCKLDAVQIHGDEEPLYIDKLRSKIANRNNKEVEIWKAIRVKDCDCIKRIRQYSADAFVLDSYVEGAYGGAGKAFDWELAREAKSFGRIILAGGLNLYNVKDAISSVQPYAVDVSSGVETGGFKDEEKIRDFVYSVRNSVY